MGFLSRFAAPKRVGEIFEPSVADLIASGTRLAAAGQAAEALALFDRALAREPLSVPGWYNRALVLGRTGRWDEALAAYDRVLVLDPDYAQAWYNKGVLLDAQGELPEGLAAYNRALGLDPTWADAWFSKGVLLAGMERPGEAVPCLEHARRLGHPLAAGYLQQMQRRAVNAADAAIVAHPLDLAAWCNKGRVLADFGRHEEALFAYERALAIRPAS
ncbi:MAG TPA: tetratricopeptide repeat protein, partial [Chloroflexia bacterium]